MRDINTIGTFVTELNNSVAWDQAIATVFPEDELQFPLGQAAWDHVTSTGTAAYCWEGIQATLCPLGLVQLDPADYPPGCLALVADGYVYVLYSAEELDAMGDRG